SACAAAGARDGVELPRAARSSRAARVSVRILDVGNSELDTAATAPHRDATCTAAYNRSRMTTLVVVRKGDSVAIAADSLTTFGDTKLAAQHDRTYDKIVRHRDTYIGLCGSAAHQLVFESLLAKHDDLDFSTKSGIFETFRKLHPILKEQHFLNPKEEEDDPYESTQITALIANGNGIFG